MYKGVKNKIAIDINNPVILPSLFKIYSKLAYANKEYHFG